MLLSTFFPRCFLFPKCWYCPDFILIKLGKSNFNFALYTIFCPIFSYVTNESLLQKLFAILKTKGHSFSSVPQTPLNEFARRQWSDILPVMEEKSNLGLKSHKNLIGREKNFRQKKMAGQKLPNFKSLYYFLHPPLTENTLRLVVHLSI